MAKSKPARKGVRPPRAAPLPRQDRFSRFAQGAARVAGTPAAFLGAIGLVAVWAVTGPFFGFSDTWQIVINTATTIVTFLMVFLIQNTQNRDTLALQIKLADLILHLRGTTNGLADAEDLSIKQLERLHARYRRLAHSKPNGRQTRSAG